MARQPYGRTGIDLKDTLTEGLESLATKAEYAMGLAVYAGAVPIQRRAIELCPRSAREPGHGRDGSHIQDKIEIEVVTEINRAYAKIGVFDVANNPYAPHIEFGDRGTPFIRPAIDETREESRAAMAEVMRDELSGHGYRASVRFKGTDARERGE